MITVANPIYDVVFKYLMEDKRIVRTITSGRATSSMEYDHHAPLSSAIAKTVLEEVKGRADLV